MSDSLQSVKFWINAFIPKTIPGYTKSVPQGIHVGKTMIPGPQRPGFGKFRIELSDCYLTDQRAFSSDIHAKSRLHSEFKLDLTGSRPIMKEWHNCDFTTECDCEDGSVECHKKGKVDRCSFVMKPSSADNSINIEMKCAASNPCAPTSKLFGDIDFHGGILFNPVMRSLEIDIYIDAFPAFEAYATMNDGAGVMMIQELPPRGNTVMNLPGSANRRMHRILIDQNGDGVFETLKKL